MASRLDRLFLLLDNGSTPLTRKAAALQLGEVQKLHPHELNTLLIKVRQYLHSSSWETRIAASQAVEAIISNVPDWFPNGSSSSNDNNGGDEQQQQNNGDDNDECRMRFDRYDIQTVIKCGHNLLASEGKDFDGTMTNDNSSNVNTNIDDTTTLDSREKIAQMRQSLNQKLGLSFAEKIGLKMDFISNADLMQSTIDESSKQSILKENVKLEQIIPKARGPIVKRKTTASNVKNEDSNDDDSSVVVGKKIKLESNDGDGEIPNDDQPDDDVNNIFDGNEWPLSWFSDELMSDLFNAQWEIRHGAAIGLREIVKLQGRCGGRQRNALTIKQDLLNQQWLEDLSLRLLSVLALDRFGDFLSDQVVAPVRETCAQVLGMIIKLLTKNGVHNVLDILLQLLQCNEWEARHGGMLGLKYLLAIRQDMIEQLLPKVFEPIFTGLKDCEDDVSAVAAAALVPIKDQLMYLMPEKVPLVIEFLWESLLVLDDLSSSTGDLLMLLSSLLTFKGLSETSNNGDDNQHQQQQQLSILIPRLWPFLSHSLSSVRRSVLESLLILSEKNSNEWLNYSSLLSDALRLLYQRSLIENHTIILDLLYKVWLNLISKTNYQCLIESTRNYVTGWICLMMQPQKIPIDILNTPVWLEIKHISHPLSSSSLSHLKKHSSLQQQQQQHLSSTTLPAENYFIGGTESLGETSEERERCTIRARYQCARLIGALAYYLTEENESQTLSSLLNGTESPQTAIVQDPLDSFACLFIAIQRMCTAWVIKEWAIAKIQRQGEQQPPWITNDNDNDDNDDRKIIESPPSLQLHKKLANRCIESLEEQIFFDEISAYVSRVQYNFRDLLTTLRTNKIEFNDQELVGKNVYTFVQINSVIDNLKNHQLIEMKQKLNENRKPNPKLKSLIECLEEKISLTRRTILDLNQLTNSYTIGVKSSLATSLIEWRHLPDRLSPIIKPVMDSIKQEDNEQLQRGSASSLVKLLNIFCERTYRNSTQSTPTAKIINNLITYLCSDRNFTPEVRSIFNDNHLSSSSSSGGGDKTTKQNSDAAQYGILALENMQKIAEQNLTLRRSNSMNMKNNNRSNNQTNDDCNGGNNNNNNGTMNINEQQQQQQDKQGEIQRRGATIALSELCCSFGQYLPKQLPSLWEYIGKISLDQQYPPTTFDENGLKLCRDLIQSLQVFEIIGPYLHPKLYSLLNGAYDFLSECLNNPFITIRHMAARCFGMLSSINLNVTMDFILTKILDMLEATDSELKRQGAVETIYFIIDNLSLKIVPYIVLLIVPMLGRMSDQTESVRLLATHCFAQLVQLMPLDNDPHQHQQQQNSMKMKSKALLLNNENSHFSQELLKRKENERHFFEQLMNIKKLDDYQLPIKVKAELRQYQQDGVNWLAFLNKYKLHGIVADEMGLGKTLQAICILASDHYYMQKRFFNNESKNKPLLSLVICPPTLTGHWMYEVEKFIDENYLSPIMYYGPPFERSKIKQQIIRAQYLITKPTTETTTKTKSTTKNHHYHNLIIASYDLVRNDIEFFSSINWNYCILDEGHVIKNGKTKLARSIKTLRANHRLILTGTPIQNNVLELWSLFDFLMPGFLGTERQFMSRYSKPILASRDAKSSSKEQEAGVLAMESLHRQVLPFILRRMKEDVLKDLPPKIMQDYYCELSQLQAQLYEDFYKSRARQTIKDDLVNDLSSTSSSSATKMAKDVESPSTTVDIPKSHIFQSLQYLRKVCNHPKLVLTSTHPNYNKIMSKLKAENTTLSDINHAAKLIALKQLLQDCGIGVSQTSGQDQTAAEPVVNQHRALIFCQLKSMLDIVEKDLLKIHMPSVTYLRLDGDVPAASRYSVIHRFNNDPSIDVLLLTIQVGGLGLNLTGADTVIFVEHDWNPMKDLQAMDRAHRIGQKKVVNVYRLITTGTLEEKIMGLQKFKLTIANTVISNENSSLDSMATDQLLDLFELKTDQSYSASATGSVSMKMMLETLPELWDTQQYENEYDLNNFLQSLSNFST
ncbi:hypothetical protein DERP_014274 [Dermatophagoides pteronyssinus]|uniref:TATA-binding protein-associated factor 172-like n=1 Tax=Dermatophagoides pteronyssinus TaxID=6956 RepID=A0ABQ8IXD9_DERPT|nr:hypothetical protein DERP_014274 [Dermatophagoides pteronyssinus]